ncbi:hypothetical protein U9M48_042317 [Paspalum notatum var. saurae]|uniref:KIB1-4 beta-propeller domain-containing protein n=1 Tax=Paspalum notatum var. saurae TaxID=547442 RepID=A0AAQ3XG21_PASNO
MATDPRILRGDVFSRLPPELLAAIHGRLGLVDRFAFAAALGAWRARHLLTKLEAPCLVLPGSTAAAVTATATTCLFSLSDRRSDTPRYPPDPAMRAPVVVLGSSGGWLVTADAQGQLWMANPVTGEQADLPAITTIPLLRWSEPTRSFLVDVDGFLQMRYSGGGAPPQIVDGTVQRGTATTTSLSAEQLRNWFYRKVILSGPPRSGGGYSAMLILARQYGAPAFATAEHPEWRLAPYRDAVEDAIFHRGRFYSITYSGMLESWDHQHGGGGLLTSTTVAPALDLQGHQKYRKYLAAAPDGRLVTVLKQCGRRTVGFRVLVLDEELGRWEEVGGAAADDMLIGKAALFVGMNSSACVATAERPGLRPGCIYFTNDQLGLAYQDWELLQLSVDAGLGPGQRDWDVGVFSLSDGMVEKILGLRAVHPFWPLPAWFLPSV